MNPRNLFPALLVAALTILVHPAAEAKLINLKTGDTLEGEVLEETDTLVTVKLLRGTTVRIPRGDIDSIEDPLPTPSPIPLAEEMPGINESLGNRGGAPTPTPIPIVPLSVRFKRVEFPSAEEGVDSVVAGAGGEENLALSLPRQSASEVIGLGNPFGRVQSHASGNKYKPFHGTWLPIRSGQTLMIGDRVHAILSEIDLRGNSGGNIGMYPSSQSQLLMNGVLVEEGKTWVRNEGAEVFIATILGVHVELKPQAVLQVEFLRSGFRLNLLQGEARLRADPDDQVLAESVTGPKSFLIGIERAIISEADVPASALNEWKTWQELFAKNVNDISTALAGVEGFTGDPNDPQTIDQYAQLERVAQALQDFYTHVGRFPHEQGGGLKELFENPGEGRWNGPYLAQSRFPLKDVWGSDVQYRLRSTPGGGGMAAEVVSNGPDKASQGGEGDDLGLLVAPPQQ